MQMHTQALRMDVLLASFPAQQADATLAPDSKLSEGSARRRIGIEDGKHTCVGEPPYSRIFEVSISESAPHGTGGAAARRALADQADL